jgi:hypothetical protein
MFKKSPLSRSILGGAILLLCLAWVGFRPLLDSDRWPEPNAQIHPDFKKHPPIAQEIRLQMLDTPLPSGANVILAARFDAATIARIDGKYLAMRLHGSGAKGKGTPPLDYLRDDGYDGDEKADDGWYSKSFTLDAAGRARLLATADQAASNARLPHNAVKFVNRQMVPNTNAAEAVTVSSTDLGPMLSLYPWIGPSPIGGSPDPLFVDHSLMITDISVVEDPTRTYNPCTNTGNAQGIWTFGELMRQLASPHPSSIATDFQTIDFILKWLHTWNNPQTVNGELVPARPSASIVSAWQAMSLANGAAPGQLLLENTPFKLLAIVNRLDLRGANGYGFNDAGEGRFVFGLTDASCGPQRMTVIFEYGINKTSCEDVHAYADEWVHLAQISFGDSRLNDALENITLQFTQCGTNPAKPHQSSLNQLRTNEAKLNPLWELREFNLISNLIPVTVKQEPAVVYNAKVNNLDVQRLASWVNANSANILANNYTVPNQYLGFDFLGGKGHVSSPPVGPPAAGSPPTPHHWDGDPTALSPARITDANTRHIFSLNTCTGCHAGETQTFFTHISTVGFGVPAPLSRFLTGDPLSPPSGPFMVPDAAGRPSYISPTMRGFNDLWRRALDLQLFIETPCEPIYIAISSLSTQVMQSPH